MVVRSGVGSARWYGLMVGIGAGGSSVEMGWIVDSLIESLSWEWSVRKESSESSHGGTSSVEMRIRILIARAWPLGFFVGWRWSLLGWEAVHDFSEPLIENLDCFQDFGDLIFRVLLDVDFEGGEGGL